MLLKGSDQGCSDCAGHVECMGEMRNAYKILVRKPEWKNHLEDLDTDGKIILKCMLNRV
jgi:hypothetical protein